MAGIETQTTPIWAPPLVIGRYDIVMDVDNDGFYDSGKDIIDSVLVRGFFVAS